MNDLRTLESLALKTSDITAILPKRIASFVERAAREHRYGRQLLRLNSQLVRTKGRSVHLPLVGTVSASRVAEAGTPVESNPTYTTTEVTPFKIGCQIHITQESIDGAEIDIINMSLEEVGIALATLEDQEIFWEMLGRRPSPTGSPATWTAQADSFTGDGTTVLFTLSQSPVLEITSITVAAAASTAYTCDFYDGKVSFTAAPASGSAIVVNYWYTARGTIIDASTKASLKYEDIVAAKTNMRANKIVCNIVVMHPDEYSDILTDIRFVDVTEYGSNQIIRGEVGQIAGLRVLVTTHMPSGSTLYLATKRAGWLVLKREIDIKRRESQETDSYKFFFYQEFAPKITDDNAVAVSVNHGAKAASL